MGSSIPARDIPRFARLYMEGMLPVDRLISHVIALDEMNEALDRLDEGTAVRQILQF